MESSKNIKSFIQLVVNENLAQAKTVIDNELNQKLAHALGSKFEEYAPAIFEELDAVGEEDEDADNDGDTDESDDYLKNRRDVRGAAIEDANEEDAESEEEDEEDSDDAGEDESEEEDEEDGSEDEESEEDDSESEKA